MKTIKKYIIMTASKGEIIAIAKKDVLGLIDSFAIINGDWKKYKEELKAMIEG